MPTFTCPQCGGEFQAEAEGAYRCPHCEGTVKIHLHVHGKVPWETWRTGRWRAFWQTWKSVMVNPVRFFKRVPPEGNFVLPLYYGLICQSAAVILMWAYQAGFQSMPSIVHYVAGFGGWGAVTFADILAWPTVVIFIIVLIVAAPVAALISLFFTSAVYHICLKILGGAKKGYEATFRSLCYGSSAQFLSIVPIVGTVIAGVWSLVLTVIGIKHLHDTTYTRAILAVVLPLFLCCGVTLLVIATIFGAAIGAWMSGYSA